MTAHAQQTPHQLTKPRLALLHAASVAVALAVITTLLIRFLAAYEQQRVNTLIEAYAAKLVAVQSITKRNHQLLAGQVFALKADLARLLSDDTRNNAPIDASTDAHTPVTTAITSWLSKHPSFTEAVLLNAEERVIAHVHQANAAQPHALIDPPKGTYTRQLHSTLGQLITGTTELSSHNGKLDARPEPVITVDLPFADADGQRHLLHLRLRVQTVLDDIARVASTPPYSHAFVIRPDSYLALATGPLSEWVFANQRGKPEGSVRQLLPGLWQALLNGDTSPVINDQGVFIFGDYGYAAEKSSFINATQLDSPIAVIQLTPELLNQGNLLRWPVVLLGIFLSYSAVLLLGWVSWRHFSMRRTLVTTSTDRDRLLTMIAHELQTPAATIEGVLRTRETIARQNLENDADSSNLSDAIHHLLNVIDDLRVVVDPTSSGSLRPSLFDLSDTLREIDSQFSALFASDHMELRLRAPNWDDTQYYTDTRRLRTVLTSLLRNAYHHSQAQHVTLSAERVHAHANYDTVILTVCDDGIGLSKHALAHLFHPNWGESDDEKSAGIGLFRAKTWVEQLGGRIRYQANEGGGACFSLEMDLPKLFGTNVAEGAVEQSDNNLLKGRQVLVIEEDELQIDLIRTSLEQLCGATVHVASTNADAHSLIAKRRFDLILGDAQMRGSGGMELAHAVRQTDAFVPIILMASPSANLGEAWRPSGADDLISKPFDVNEFCLAVRTLFHLKGIRLNSAE